MVKTDENPLLKEALEYHRRGWCVIPIPQGKKAARIRWKRYQAERATGEQVRKWFAGNNRNIAVVLGGVSGGLACLDFDTEQGYQQWAGEHRDLAAKLPTVKTTRGYHVYFLADVDKIQSFNDGELRGKGGYCLLPPSVHPDGVIYEWLIEPNGKNLLALDPVSAGLSQDSCNVTERTERTERTEENRGGLRRTQEIYVNEKIEKAIIKTLPKRFRTRHRSFFDFARQLYSMPEYTDADPKQFYSVVKEWHKGALPNIGTREFEETWIDFLQAWPKIRWRKETKPMSEIFEKTKTTTVPEFALRYDNPKLRLLVVWCKILQERAGNSSFFLSARTAGKYLDIDLMKANRWLFLLEQDRILEVVEKGKLTRAGGIATRFRYIAN